ncbi:hypothetical protein GCM10010123_41380 [Pilimelia anulata]|uniref:Uncharacterized protein n=1 Tax=Pilimelia anulata TaxID=53371 RepID=A0A8J3BFP1_9ACTN|nr:hypothetical protein GCM10010123_41380 [Pilimelia anulata]
MRPDHSPEWTPEPATPVGSTSMWRAYGRRRGRLPALLRGLTRVPWGLRWALARIGTAPFGAARRGRLSRAAQPLAPRWSAARTLDWSAPPAHAHRAAPPRAPRAPGRSLGPLPLRGVATPADVDRTDVDRTDRREP